MPKQDPPEGNEELVAPPEAAQDAQDAPDAQEDNDKGSPSVVKYIGTADVRLIDEEGWHSAGAPGQPAVKWDRSNNWTVPVTELSDAALEYCDVRDPGLVVQ